MENRINKNLVYLNKHLSNLDSLLVYLRQEDILSDPECDTVSQERTALNKNKELLNILKSKDFSRIGPKFIKILRETHNEHCADILEDNVSEGIRKVTTLEKVRPWKCAAAYSVWWKCATTLVATFGLLVVVWAGNAVESKMTDFTVAEIHEFSISDIISKKMDPNSWELIMKRMLPKSDYHDTNSKSSLKNKIHETLSIWISTTPRNERNLSNLIGHLEGHANLIETLCDESEELARKK